MARRSSMLTTKAAKRLKLLRVAVAVEAHLRLCLDRLKQRLRRVLAKTLEKIR